MSLKLTYFLLFLNVYSSFAYAQTLTKTQTDNDNNIYSKYHWEVVAGHHGASIDLILFKDKTYKYYSSYPLSFQDSSQGFYSIKKDKLILNSYLKEGSIPVRIEYVDTPFTSFDSARLYFPKNSKGETIFSIYYYLNKDTSLACTFDPMVDSFEPISNNITSIKIKCYNNAFSSNWISITNTHKYILVTLDTDLNFDDFKELRFVNKTYMIKKNQLIESK